MLTAVTLLIFALLQLVSPVERSALYVRDIPHNAQVLESVIQRYGLDDPLPVQYWHWLVGQLDPVTGVRVGGILRGDLGYSRTAAQPVAELIARRFPATLELTLFAIGPIIGLGTWLGIVAALKQHTFIDQALRLFSVVGASLPAFVTGLLLLMALYAGLGWFPPGRLSDWANVAVSAPSFRPYTSLITVDALLNGRFDIWLDALRHLCLPVVTLVYASLALYVRVVRAAMLDTLRQEYILTARSKGLRRRTVIYRHALRNALIPLITLSSLTAVGLLGGVVLIETIFGYPGIGAAAGQAAAQLDVITTLAFTLLASVVVVCANLAADVLYTVLDPRVRL